MPSVYRHIIRLIIAFIIAETYFSFILLFFSSLLFIFFLILQMLDRYTAPGSISAVLEFAVDTAEYTEALS